MLILTLLAVALAIAAAEQLVGVDGAFRRALIDAPARYLSRTGPLQWMTAAAAIVAVLGLLIVAPEIVAAFGVADAAMLMDVAILATMIGAWRHVRTAAVAVRSAVRGLAAHTVTRMTVARRERTTPRRRSLALPRSDDPEPAWLAAAC